jgi:hypothetical protein
LSTGCVPSSKPSRGCIVLPNARPTTTTGGPCTPPKSRSTFDWPFCQESMTRAQIGSSSDDGWSAGPWRARPITSTIATALVSTTLRTTCPWTSRPERAQNACRRSSSRRTISSRPAKSRTKKW